MTDAQAFAVMAAASWQVCMEAGLPQLATDPRTMLQRQIQAPAPSVHVELPSDCMLKPGSSQRSIPVSIEAEVCRAESPTALQAWC